MAKLTFELKRTDTSVDFRLLQISGFKPINKFDLFATDDPLVFATPNEIDGFPLSNQIKIEVRADVLSAGEGWTLDLKLNNKSITTPILSKTEDGTGHADLTKTVVWNTPLSVSFNTSLASSQELMPAFSLSEITLEEWQELHRDLSLKEWNALKKAVNKFYK